MAKVKNPSIKSNQFESGVYSKRTIKKSGGDNFTHNVRTRGLKSKRKKSKN